MNNKGLNKSVHAAVAYQPLRESTVCTPAEDAEPTADNTNGGKHRSFQPATITLTGSIPVRAYMHLILRVVWVE